MKNLKLVVISIFVLFAIAFKFSSSSVVNSQTGLSIPTGVIASDGKYTNKIRVEWDTIRGATTYRVFRNTTNDSATATSIGTTPANTFLDSTAAINQTFFYWVKAENGAITSDFSASDQGLRASGTQQGPIPPLEAPPIPTGNAISASKVYLGKTLFWDEQMSSTKTVSCGTCHTAGGGGDDLRASNTPSISTNPGSDLLFGNGDDVIASRGIPNTNIDGTYSFSSMFGLNQQVTGRSSMSNLNSAYSPILFWDGRATGTFRDPITNAVVLANGGALENQILGPPLSSAEMAHSGRNWAEVVNRLSDSKPLAVASNIPLPLKTWINGRNYSQLFEEVFGTNEISASRIALAIATYQRTLYSDQTPMDMANAGILNLTQQEQNGRQVFVQVGCGGCHLGAVTSDNSFRYIGVRPPNEDTGRFQVTGNNGDLGRFRVPDIRNAELRGTYFHNGRINSIEGVVAFYNRGGDFNAPNKDPNVRPRNLTQQQQTDLATFLKRPLTDPRVANELPPFDRPSLFSDSNRVPVISGTGVAGSGGQIPQPIAIEPPFVGNPSFTVAVTNAIGGANATLVINSTDPGTAVIPFAGSFTRQTLTLQGSGSGNGSGSINLAIPSNNALIGQTFFGRWYVSDVASVSGFSVSRLFTFTIFGETLAVSRGKRADFDGDNKTDISVFRPTSGDWFITNSSTNLTTATNFGLTGDILTPEDFDGDGKADVAVFRNGTWYILRSRDGFQAIHFGQAGDKPQAADYDGDSVTDVAVFRPSNGTWYAQRSAAGFTASQFGIMSDRPVAADYDGDGKADFAVYRDGIWYVLGSQVGFVATQFGIAEDKPVIGDYDGDGKSDFAVFRPSNGTWYKLASTNNSFSGTQFGISSDIPTPGDYDGDGKSDLAVFRQSEGNWYILQSSNGGFRQNNFGVNGDFPVPSAIVP
jgi:cytochrome c peroxidase